MSRTSTTGRTVFARARQAMDAMWKETMRVGGGWILEVDVRKFFDTLDHTHLRELAGHRIRDGVIRRLIGKWLNAGVMEDGNISYPESGSPQGGCISPILANVYLHYVLDVWFEKTVKPQLSGSAKLIRLWRSDKLTRRCCGGCVTRLQALKYPH